MEDDDRTMLPPAGGTDDPDKTVIRVADPDQTVIRVAPRPASAPPAPAPPQDDPQALPAGYRLGDFEVSAKLGQGGFSIVYLAWEHSLRRAVALKEYMPAALALRTADAQVMPRPQQQETFDVGMRSFVEEARTLVKFDHPALVRVHQYFQANSTAYMVMQLVKGTTLEAVAAGLGSPPDEAWLLQLLDPLTAALQIVHAERIVHRDIAPDNVMILEGSRRPLLLDFGAARQVIGDSTRAPTAMLKPSYAPIEQYPESGLQQGAWTDIYALAGVVHRLISGTAPPNSQGRVLKDNYVPLATRFAGKYSARFLKAVDHALVLRPEQRTQSVAAFRAEMGLDQPGSPAADAPQRERPSRRALWIGLGALGIVAAAGTAFVVLRHPAAPDSAAQTAAASPPEPVPAPSAPGRPAPADTQPAAAARGPLDPAAAFEQIVQGQAPERRIAVTVDAAELKANVTPLRLRVTSPRDGYYYVFIHDTDRQVRVLFPNADLPQNDIAAGETAVIPRVKRVKAGAGVFVEQTPEQPLGEPTGPAQLLVVVSATPLDLSAAVKSTEGAFQVLLQGDAAAGAGVPGRPLYLGRPQCQAGSPCPEGYGAAAVAIRVVP